MKATPISAHAIAGKPVVNWRMNGTADFSGWILGERITKIDDLVVDEVYVQDSPQFNAMNMVKITSIGKQFKPHNAYGSFVSPSDISKPRMADDRLFAISPDDLHTSFIYRVKRAEKSLEIKSVENKGIGLVRIVSKDMIFDMLLKGQKLCDLGAEFTHVIRPNTLHKDALTIQFDDKESFEYVNVQVLDRDQEETTYQVFCDCDELMLIDAIAHEKLMNSSDYTRTYLRVFELERT
jgi:hypothetical protein